MARTALRRYYDERALKRRLKMPRYSFAAGDKRLMGIFRWTACTCSCIGCGNRRGHMGPTMQERRHAG